MKNHILKFLRENTAILITFAFAIISFILWIFSSKEPDISDLWLNLLAGFVASICTILVIDNILKRQKEKAEQPFRIAFYRDIQLFASRIISFWQEMYTQSVENRTEIEISTLFSESVINEIYLRLDLEGNPNVIPKQDWFVYIDSNATNLVEFGTRILDRYVSVAEPELFQAIHYLISDSSFIAHLLTIKHIRALDIRNNFPRHPLLVSYSTEPTEKDYIAIKTLFDWCLTEYKMFENTDFIYQIPKKVVIINPSNPPSSIMTTEKILHFAKALETWRNLNPIIQ